MSRGKQKGSVRSEVKRYPDIRDKLRVSISGSVAKYAERVMYVSIRGIPFLRSNATSMGLTPAKLAKKIREIKQRMGDAVAEAIKKNDARFFERMAEIARFYEGRTVAADPMGADIIGAWLDLNRAGIANPSRRQVAEHMDKVYPRPDGKEWGAREVGRAINEMGLKAGQ
jgi:hypothetical protein